MGFVTRVLWPAMVAAGKRLWIRLPDRRQPVVCAPSRWNADADSKEYAVKRRVHIGKEASREIRPRKVGEASRPNVTLSVAEDK